MKQELPRIEPETEQELREAWLAAFRWRRKMGLHLDEEMLRKFAEYTRE